MLETLKGVGKIGALLLLLNEIRGILVVTGVIVSWSEARAASTSAEAAATALISGLKCAALLVCS